METSEKPVGSTLSRTRKQPILCRIILFSALTYFLILALLFLAGLVFSGKIIDILSSYYGQNADISGNFLWVALTGTSLYFTAVAGITLFILNRKTGFYIFFVASIMIFTLDLSYFIFDWLRYLIHTGYIFILGIAYFSKRCYN